MFIVLTCCFVPHCKLQTDRLVHAGIVPDLKSQNPIRGSHGKYVLRSTWHLPMMTGLTAFSGVTRKPMNEYSDIESDFFWEILRQKGD